MEPTLAHKPSLGTVLSESFRIIKDNYTHFINLSFLFLPLSIYLLTTPIFDLSEHLNFIKHHICYVLSVYLLSLCATATIIYTTYHLISGKPVSFFTTLKFLTCSFFRVVTTAILVQSLLFLMVLGFISFVGIILTLLHYLGFSADFAIDYVIDYESVYFMGFFCVTCVILIITVTYFHVSWSLAIVVAVVELKWGFAALTRSSDLMKGARSVPLWLCLHFGFFLWFFVVVFVVFIWGSIEDGWGYALYATIILDSGPLMLILLHNIVAMTVLYNECKAFHCELGDDGIDVKIPHVVEA